MTAPPSPTNPFATSDADLTDPLQVQANAARRITDEQRRSIGMWLGSRGVVAGCMLLTLVPITCIGTVTLAPYLAARWPPVWPTGALVDSTDVLPIVMAAIVIVALLTAAVRFAANASTLWRARGDLAAGRVSMAVGRVAWKKGQYEPSADEHGAPARLRFVTRGKSPLAPGDYRFYFLSTSGLILSAERLGEGNTPPPVIDIDTEPGPPSDMRAVLARANGHGVAALALNRQGRLDRAQAVRLWRKAAGEVAFGAVFAMVPILFLRMAGGDMPMAAFFVLGLFGLFGVLWCVRALRIVADAVAGNVQSEEGVGTTAVHRSRRSDGHRPKSTYYLVVGDRKFEITQGAYQAVIDGLGYRVYFTPRSASIVGIEPAEDEGGATGMPLRRQPDS